MCASYWSLVAGRSVCAILVYRRRSVCVRHTGLYTQVGLCAPYWSIDAGRSVFTILVYRHRSICIHHTGL